MDGQAFRRQSQERRGSPADFLLRTDIISKLLSVALSGVILSLASGGQAAAQTGVEYGHMVSQSKGHRGVNSRAFKMNTQSRPQKTKPKKPWAESPRRNHLKKPNPAG